MPSQLSHPFEVTEDLNFNASAEVVKPEVVYSYINAICGDDWEDGPVNDLESFSDNESLHPEDWESHPGDPGRMSLEDAYISFDTSRPVEKAEEDHLSTTKEKVNKPEPSNPARPTVNVITEDDPKESLPEFIVHRGVCHYWTAVEVPTVVHHSK